MKFVWIGSGTALFLLLGVLWNSVEAGGAAARQRYSGWEYNQEKNYYYRKYEYKPTPTAPKYEYQYAIYYKNDPKINNKWIYYYNPKTETYWGRYPTVHHDKYKEYAQQRQEVWSVVPMQDRYQEKDLYKIKLMTYFPEAKVDYCPTLPGATDNTVILAPPPDLP